MKIAQVVEICTLVRHVNLASYVDTMCSSHTFNIIYKSKGQRHVLSVFNWIITYFKPDCKYIILQIEILSMTFIFHTTAELSQEKRLWRKYERKYKQSKLTVDKLQLQERRNEYYALLNSTKKEYIKIRLKMPNHQKIFINYGISFWIGNKKPYYHHMIVLNR